MQVLTETFRVIQLEFDEKIKVLADAFCETKISDNTAYC